MNNTCAGNATVFHHNTYKTKKGNKRNVFSECPFGRLRHMRSQRKLKKEVESDLKLMRNNPYKNTDLYSMWFERTFSLVGANSNQGNFP